MKLTVTHNHQTIDIFGKETYDLLEQVCLELKHENEENLEEDGIERAKRYTGLHSDVLHKLWQDSITIDTLKEIDRKDIYNELMKFNLELNVMPTTTDLFNALQPCLPPFVDIRSFRNKLVEMGYIFKKTDSNTTVVIENPEVRFQRYLYLKNIAKYREEKRPIYFVCEGALNSNKVLNIDECEQEQQEGWQHRFICAVSSKEVKNFQHITKGSSFEKWTLDTLVELDEGSVIVFDNSKHLSEKFCETPNPHSLKCDMIEWLKYHKIPFSQKMSRLELWMLIEKFTDLNANLYKIDNIVKQCGCDVLRLPDCINNITPASYLLIIIEKNLIRDIDYTITVKRLEDLLKNIDEKKCNIIDNFIATEEKRLIELDTQLDNIIDNLVPSTNPEIDTCLPILSNFE
ncbi:unnamed protein product [Euphydryas editha]|uniref:Uncharacterized protein n=1 Tax=Euphydryas editha TaxID=104508 RepID=A0AAU9UJQ2_EUPED|nr:unnamed protein product [Euphydryas editha]